MIAARYNAVRYNTTQYNFYLAVAVLLITAMFQAYYQPLSVLRGDA